MQNPLDDLKNAIHASISTHGAIASAAKRQNRSICKKFYVNEEEDQQIQQLCQGVKESRFFRSRVLGKAIPRPKTTIPQENRLVYTHFANIRLHMDLITKTLKNIAQTSQPLSFSDIPWENLQYLDTLLREAQLQLSLVSDGTEEDDDDWED